jgi:hypothetical protein
MVSVGFEHSVSVELRERALDIIERAPTLQRFTTYVLLGRRGHQWVVRQAFGYVFDCTPTVKAVLLQAGERVEV